MFKGDMKTFWPALLFFVAASLCPQLTAGPVYPDCEPGSLQDYINSSGCVLGGSSGGIVVFSGFIFPAPLNPDDITALGASDIELTPVPSGLGGSFDFSGAFSVPAGDTITYDIDYFLLLDPGPILGGGSLTLDPSGDVSVTESICADSLFATVGDNTVCQYNTPNGVVDSAPQSLSVDDSNPPYSLSASIALDPPAYNFAYVDTTIVLTGGSNTPATSGGVVVTDNVEPLPEPMTSLLCLGGLTALGIFRRRFIV
jgi:hypothetical protein